MQGKYHTVAIVPASATATTSGTVYTWGRNDKGQLGNGTTNDSWTRVEVKTDKNESIRNAVAVAAAGNFSMALTSDGYVYAWGENNFGQLGDGTTTNRTKAVLVKGPTGDGAAETGKAHQSGIGYLSNIKKIAVSYAPSSNTNETYATAYAVERPDTDGLYTNGHMYSWGSNHCGQLANATYYDSLYPVMQSDLEDVISVSAGIGFAVARKSNGNLFAWGTNTSGQLGNSTYDEQLVPIAVGADAKLVMQEAKIVQASATPIAAADTTAYSAMTAKTEYTTTNLLGRTITLTNDADGYVEQFIINKDKIIDDLRFYLYIEKTEAPEYFKVEDVYVEVADPDLFDVYDNWIVTPTGAVNKKYAVTTLTVQDRTRNIAQTFTLEFKASATTADPLSKTIEASPMVASNSNNSIALMSDGTVWTWGDNTYGQLGNDSTSETFTPVQVRDPDTTEYLTGISKVAQGARHSVALAADGHVYTWGDNRHGQLGNGDMTDDKKLKPVKVVTVPATDTEPAVALENVIDIAAGDDFTVALDASGNVWVFGNNADNMLGVYVESGETITDIATDINVARRVMTERNNTNTYLSGIVQIAAGSRHILALTEDGDVWAWGDNTYGQLGEGTYSATSQGVNYRTAPVAVDIHDVEKIYAGYNNSAAIKMDSTAWAWGDNSHGQVGDNKSAAVVPIPVQVLYRQAHTDAETGNVTYTNEKLNKVSQIAIGKDHMNALTQYSNKVLTWGRNLNKTVVPEDPDNPVDKSGIDSENNVAVELLNDITTGDAVDDVIMVTAGGEGDVYTTVILRSTGDVYALGNNTAGQIGDGTKINRDVPVLVGIGRATNNVLLYDATIQREDPASIGNYIVDETYSEASGHPLPYEVNLLHTQILDIDENALRIEIDPGFNLITGAYKIQGSAGDFTYKSLDDSVAYSDPTDTHVIKPTRYTDDAYLGATYIVVEHTPTGAKGIVRINVLPLDLQEASAKPSTSVKHTSKVYPQVAVGGHGKEGSTLSDTVMAGVTDEGELYLWGDNTYSQLGKDFDRSIAPYKTSPVKEDISEVKKVAIGDGFVIAITANGEAFAWGRNDKGQLGIGNNTTLPTLDEDDNVSLPIIIQGIPERIIDVAAGRSHALLLTESGTVYGFGSGSKYQVTPESSEEKIDAPQRLYMKDSIRIAAIFADNDTSYALTRGGDILVWGDKSKSQFGTTDYAGNGFIYSETPTTEKMVTMSASTDTIMTLSENNQVYGWGNNDYNQLGMYDAQNATYSTVVNTPTLSTSYNFSPLADGSVWIPSSISAGQNSYVVYQNGKARALGRNSDYGQLGVHDESFNATDGSYSTLYTSDVDGDGILDADGVFLMLHAGDSDPENDDPSADPPVHTEFKNAKAIATAANGMNGIVYDKYGRMYAWGDNSRGQIGDGTQMSRNYPAAVLLDGGGSYIDFSEATVTRNGIDYDLKMYYDTYVRSDLGSGDIGMLETAVRTEDKIQIKLSDVFGVNGFTLFGESTYVPENLEFQVINTANTTIAGFTNSTSGTLNVGTEAGTTYLIAKDSLNNTGVIKLNVIPKETDSTLAANLSTMPMIAIGDDHTISLKSDGTVWAWGNNSYSQLGTGSQEIYTLLPEQVMKADSSGHPEPLTDIIKIAASGVHNLALDKDGHVWAWGSGFKGALGNGSKTNQNTRTYAQLINLYNDDDEMYLFGNDKDNNTTFTSRIIDIGASGTGHVYREDSDKQYSYALDADGNVYGWGLNYNGVIMPQTTNGAVVTRPVNVSSRNIIIKGARKLAPDKIGETMHVLKADGQIISWGDNSDGAYGIGSDPATTPSRTVLPTKAKAVAAYGGVNNAMAILMEGKVVMWGDLRQGQLGNGIDASNQIYDIPVDATNYEWANAGAFPIGGDISEYVQVMYDNYGLDANGVDGNLISAGINGPALGRGDFGGIPNGSSIEVASKVVAGKSDVTGNIKKVILVANAISSDKLSVITTNNGAVWAYGDNENGLIGDGTKIQRDKDKPSRVGTSYFLLEEFTKSLQVGEVQDLVHPRIASFNLFSGAEGTPTDDRELVWQTWDNQNNIADIIPGSSTLDKKIKGTGIGTTYVIVSLADDSMTVGAYKVEVRPNDSTYGTTMIDPGDTSYAYPQVVTGTNTTYALKPNGTVWVWGGNEYGQFGNGNVYGTELFPTQIDQSKFGNQPIIKIAAAGDSVFAIDANHHVWAWGRNDKGQLGLGETMEKVVTPSLVHRGDQNVDSTIADPDNDPMAPYMHDIVDVTVGGIDNDSLFALFLQKDGVVYGSGDNNYNQLGYTKTPGTKTVPTSYNEPVKLTNTVQQFAIGKSATAHMLRLDGKVYSMGKGTSFEYGTGNNTDNPLLRAGTADMDNRAMAVGAGAENVMALTYNLDQNNNIDSTVTGSIYVWGANRNGELDASGTDITLPTRLPIINRITLFGGGDAIYAVNNGTPIMAGVGTDGQLGLGTLSAASYTITDLSNEARTATGATFNNVISMSSSVGGSHTAFVDVDGYVWAYGNNSKGQIANQTVTENKMYAEQVGSDLIVTLDKSEILVKPGQDGQINYQARSGFNLYRDITDTTVDSAIYTSLDTGTATVGASTGLVSYANTGKTYVKFTAQKAGSADKTLFVHVIALPDDSAKPADEKYIAYPQVAAGDNFILALRANGDLYAWGDNTYGQLGLGLGRVGSVDYKPQRVIVTIPQYDINGDYIGESDPVKFTKIAAGADFSMAIDSDGNLYTWGRNDRGQIGDGTDTSKDISSSAYATVGNKEKLVPSPQKVTSFTDYGVKMQEVSAGGSAGHSYAMALTNTGDVFAWGHNSTHQVDNSSNAIVSTPSYVPVTRMTSIAAGNGIVDSTTGDDVATSYAVQEMGRVLVWGNNAYGEAGLGNTTGLAGKQWIVDDIQIPERALEVKAGAGNAFVMTENTSGTDYKYYGWGVNDHAQLSHNSPMTSAGSTSPVELSSSISAFANAASISTGDATILVQKDGNVYVSGRNTSGKLATANNVDYKVENIEQAAISNVLDAAVSANGNVSAFITKDGYIMTAGNNERGQLGNAVVNSDDYYTTTPVQVFTDSIDVDGLDDNIATLGKAGDTKDLTVTYNEFNAFNKTLNANFMYRSTNPAIADVTDNGNGNITVSYKSIGSARIVVYGQITKADGQTYDKYALFDVNVLPSNAEPSESVQPMVVTGNEFTVALTSDGHVYSWGDNSRGQGSFNTNKKTIITPTAVQRSGAMLSDIVSVAVGDNFTLAATRDGEVWSWGRNDKGVGQLGRKLTSNTSLYTPNKVNDVAATPSADPTTGLTLGGVNTGKVVKVFASGLTAAALTDQGTVYVWGDNSYGQLGIGHDMLTKYGSSSSSNIPIRMYGIDNAIDVMITERNIMIVNRDGTVYVTGNNEYGVLGNGEIWTGIHENSGKNLTIALPVMDKLDDGSTAILEGAANAAIGKEHAILNLYQYKADSDGAGTPAIVNELYAYGRNDYGVLGNGTAYREGENKFYSDNYDDNGVQLEADKNASGDWVDANGNEAERIVLFPNDKEKARINKWTKVTTYEDGVKIVTDVKEPLENIHSVFAGDHFSGAVAAGVLSTLGTGAVEKNYVYMWGDNIYDGYETGVLGNKSATNKQYRPRLVFKDDKTNDYLETIIQVPARLGGSHVAAISSKGVVYEWGKNTKYQLGDGTQINSVTPVVVGSANMIIRPASITISKDNSDTFRLMGMNMFAVYKELQDEVGAFDWRILDDSVAKLTFDERIPTNAIVLGATEGETRAVVTHRITGQTVFGRIIVTDDVTYAQMQLGKDFTVALKKDGTVWVWGDNENGAIGTGSSQKKLTIPVRIDEYYKSISDKNNGVISRFDDDKEKILKIAVGEDHVVAVGRSGKVYTWGSNAFGKLGLDAAVSTVDRPLLLDFDTPTTPVIVDIAAGTNHTLAATATGEVYSWGRNNKGQLGRKTVTSDYDTSNYKPQLMQGVGEGSLTGVIMVAATAEASGVLLANGTVWTVGGNSRGELGTGILPKDAAYNTQLERVIDIGEMDDTATPPVNIDMSGVTRLVGKGYNFGVILTQKKYLTNADGTPKMVNQSQAYSYLKNRQVYIWGDNTHGQLGTDNTPRVYGNSDGNGKYVTVPVRVVINHTDTTHWKAEDTSGSAWDPEYGDDPMSGKDSDTSEANILRNIANLSIGYDSETNETHVLAIDRAHHAYAWGSNTYNELGTNTNGDYETATAIRALYEKYDANGDPVITYDTNGDEVWNDLEIIGVSAGSTHSAAFLEDGLVYTWGHNQEGQLGNYTINEHSEYAQRLPGYVDEEYIALGEYNIVLNEVDDETDGIMIPAAFMRSFSLGDQIDKDKSMTLTATVMNEDIAVASMDLTQPNTTKYNIPYINIKPQAFGDTKLIVRYTDNDDHHNDKIAVANISVLRQKFADGTPDTTGNYKVSPMMESGDGFTVALRANGEVYTWGKNNKGQLANGSQPTERNIMLKKVEFAGLADGEYITRIAAGREHVIALASDGSVWAWGNNNQGQLGRLKSDIDFSTIPVQVGLINNIDTLNGLNIVDVFAGEYASYLITDGKTDIKIGAASNGQPVKIPLDTQRNTYVTGNANKTYNTSSKAYEYTGTGFGDKPQKLSIVQRVSKIAGSEVLKTGGTVWKLPMTSDAVVFEKRTDIDTADPDKPYILNDIVDISSKSPAGMHTLALNSKGNVLAWGAGTDGQLATSATEVLGNSDPAFVLKQTGTNPDTFDRLDGIIDIGAGENHSVALRLEEIEDPANPGTTINKGVVYTWGLNNHGQLGTDKSTAQANYPIPVAYITSDPSIIHVDGGYEMTSTMASDGYMWTFGKDKDGQLGNVDVSDSAEPVLVGKGELTVTPTEISIMKGSTQPAGLTIAASSSFNLFDDAVSGGAGTVTYTSLDPNIFTVDGVPTVDTITGVNAGKALLKVYNGLTAYVTVTVKNTTGDNYTPMVAAGQQHTVVLKANGEVYTWGDNTSGQLGRSDTDEIGQVVFPGGDLINFVAASATASYAISDTDGRVYAWGNNDYKQLGSQTKTSLNDILVIQKPGGGNLTDIKEISTEGDSVLLLDKNGKVYTLGQRFGLNSYNIAEIKQTLPGVMQISGMYARTQAGTVWHVESDGSVQKVVIKDENGSDVSIIKIAAGVSHLLALDEDGNVWVVGSNADKQLGELDTDKSYTQGHKIEDLTDVYDIAAGANTSYALKKDATDGTTQLYSWGLNDHGQLGYTNSTSPIVRSQSAPQNILGISAGFDNVFTVDTDGRVWGSGLNSDRQLANGESEDSYKFVICGDSQIIIEKLRSDNSVESTGYGTIYFVQGEATKRLRAKYKGFNVFTQTDADYSDYDFTFEASDPTLLTLTPHLDALSNPIKGYADADASSYTGTLYVRVYENTMLNKTSFAKVVVLPDTTQNNVTEHSDKFLPKMLQRSVMTVLSIAMV